MIRTSSTTTSSLRVNNRGTPSLVCLLLNGALVITRIMVFSSTVTWPLGSLIVQNLGFAGERGDDEEDENSGSTTRRDSSGGATPFGSGAFGSGAAFSLCTGALSLSGAVWFATCAITVEQLSTVTPTVATTRERHFVNAGPKEFAPAKATKRMVSQRSYIIGFYLIRSRELPSVCGSI